MSEKRIVVDSSAFLALAHRETGSQQVAEYLENARGIMSAINAAEVISKQSELGVPPKDALTLLQLAGIVIVAFGPDEALIVASLCQTTLPLGLSLGDRACLALGLKSQCPILTADRIWSKVVVGVEIVCIR
jgi:PIN domain nuclease of toxin-antitoxin system